MDTVTRRRFLIGTGVVGAGALAGGAAAAYSLRDILATAGDRPADAGTLVVVTLYGGNDGLNTVVPHADPAYQDARPELAYAAGDVLPLSAEVGLNPSLKGLHRLYSEGRLAVVRGVGYPKPDRSHFRSMDIWQTASPQRPGTTGWLGRWLDAAGGDPRLAVSFEPVLPPLMAGERSAGAAVALSDRKQPASLAAAAGFATAAAGEPPLQARAAGCFADLRSVDEMITPVREAAGAEAGADDGGDGAAPATGTGGRAALDAQLELVAQCVEAGVATRAYSVSLGGFDTHADEKQLQEILLRQVDEALTPFLDRMAKTEAGRKVVVAVYSEFGRRVRANGSEGTDHGTASNVLLLGAGVRGGLHGEPPSLTDLDDGDLKFTTDFRDVYAMLLADVLGADPAQALDGWKGRLPSLV